MSPNPSQISINYDDDGRSLSSETRAVVEDEVKRLLTAAYARATAVLKQHEKELHALAQVTAVACSGALNGRHSCGNEGVAPGWGYDRVGFACGAGWRRTYYGGAAISGLLAGCVAGIIKKLITCLPLCQHFCVQELVDKETLTGSQIRELVTRVNGKKGGVAAPAS